MEKAKIVVIGAGASGIAAATKLLSFGFKNVTVLEAQDRVGGRIYTIPFGDNKIDLGAQWVHGQKDNVVYNLVKDLDVLDSTGKIYYDYQCVRSNGEVLSDEVTDKLKSILNVYWDSKETDLAGYDGSLGSYLKEKFLTTLKEPEYSDIDRDVALEFLENFRKFEVSMECCDSLYDVSGSGHLDYWNCEGDLGLNWRDKGYESILKLLMKSNGTDFGILNNTVFLRKEVTKISWNPNGLEKVKIKSSEGIEIEADHVICTVSLGVLKERFSHLFEPKLPENKINAIRGLGIGTVNKVFIHFPQKFWPDSWTGCTLQWKKEDLVELRQSEFAWLENVFGFYVVSYQPNVISSWVVGPSARYVETLSKAEQLKGIMYMMRRFLRYQIPEPIDFIVTSWYSNPFVRGSYSHRSMETEHLNTGASELASPILAPSGRPIVQFAGEATHDHYYSTVHGAVGTGWREAQRLLQYYSQNKSKL